MSGAIADAAAREVALDPTGSFIVQAPAGSGKTELLTQRLLVLLATVDEPEEVVAMTFTRKAAAEMRHRVFAAIRAAAAPAPEDAHRRRTWTLARAVLQRSQQRGWRLEDSPQRLRVRTIDALCSEIVRQAPLGSKLGGAIEITESAEPLYREAARAVLRQIETGSPEGAAVARVLAHFDNRTGTLEGQIVEMLRRRDQWQTLVTHTQRAGRSRAALEAAFAEVVRNALVRADAALPAQCKTAWLASAAHASAQRCAGEPDLVLHSLRNSPWPGTSVADLPRWHALLDLVFTQDREARKRDWRKTADARLGFPAGKTKAEKAQWGPARDAHLRLIAELSAQTGLREDLLALYTLPDPTYDDVQWEVLEALLDTLLLASAQLRLVFAARGVADFAEIAAQAVAALGDPQAPSELALRLDYRIRHVLVDEFQDTSATQWGLLLRLTAGWSTGDGRTLFVVGDPMQSIYRFREADVGLYLRALDRGIGDLRLQPLQLQCNFRSRAGIVDWVNATFSQVLPQHDDIERSAVRYAPAQPVRAPAAGAAVQVHAFVDAGPQAEAQRVIDIVRHAQQRAPRQRIAILVRNRGHLLAITTALREAGITYRAVDLEGLAERPVIADLRALTRALLHPLDRVTWLAVLRAPWCGLRLADLHTLAAGLPPQQSLLAALRDPARLARLSEDGAARLQRTLETLEAARAQQGRLPLRRWIEATWIALGGPACAGGDSALQDAAVFLDCLQRLAPGAVLEDFAALDLALDALKASADPSAGDALSVMTIHKSKGLEFDTVIVPGLGRGTRSDDPPPVTWMHRGAGEDTRLLLAPVHATGDARSASYDYLRTLESERQRHEDARLLYVAATRAREQLHLLGEVRRDARNEAARPPERSLLARLWPVVDGVFAEAAAQAPPQAPGGGIRVDRPPPPLRRLLNWPVQAAEPGLPLPSPATVAGSMLRYDWAGELARRVGLAYHRFVQHIAEDGIARWPAARCGELGPAVVEELRALGVPQAHRDAAVRRVLLALENTLVDPRGRWLLQAHTQAVSELDLGTWRDGRYQRRVIDRSFVDAQGQRWIVDFKTGTHEGGDVDAFVHNELERYRGQLQDYCTLMRQLDPVHPVRAALYLPLLADAAARWVELDA